MGKSFFLVVKSKDWKPQSFVGWSEGELRHLEVQGSYNQDP